MSVLSTSVKNISDLMSIALKAEREAIRRYSLLAATMREGDNKSTADLFERLVNEEQEHEKLLLEWMAQEGIDENPDIGAISWQDPNISTSYRDEAHDPYQSSPYKALAFAVHNEEIAFRFYTHVAAHSDSEAVRKYAETLAKEELEHIALLRTERRRAYHAERETNEVEPRLDPKTVHNEMDLLAAAIQIDQILLNEMNKEINNLPEIRSLVSEIRLEIDTNKRTLHDRVLDKKESPGDDISNSLEKLKFHFDCVENKARTQAQEIQRLYAHCDRSFAFYSAIVETTADETVMLTAQKLTSLALDRLGVLNEASSEK